MHLCASHAMHAVCGGKTFANCHQPHGMFKGSNQMSQDKAHNLYFPLLGETQLFDWTANIPKLFSKNLHAQFQLLFISARFPWPPAAPLSTCAVFFCPSLIILRPHMNLLIVCSNGYVGSAARRTRPEASSRRPSKFHRPSDTDSGEPGL